MKSNKVLLITSEFPPQPGGIGTHAYQLGTALAAEGKMVTVLCDQRSKDGIEESTFDALLKVTVNRTKRITPLFITFFNRINKAISLARKHDVVLVSGKFSLWTGAILKRVFKKKSIAILHGSELLLPGKIEKRLTSWAIKQMDACISVSKYTASLVGTLQTPNFIIPNGCMIDCSNLPPQKKMSQGISLVTVGNLTQRKGQHNVITALPLLLKRYPKLQYKVIGIPTEIDRLQALAYELDVSSHISFMGRVSENEKPHLLKEQYVFIMLSEQTSTGDVEGFGIAVIEANALGLPAIGSKGCGIEDAIKEDYSGFLVDPHDPESIDKALENIILNYDQFSENAKKWASNFEWPLLIKKYLEVIESI